MSGEQERRNGLARPDQPDLIESTVTMSRPAEHEQGPANGHRRDGLARDGAIGPADEPHHGARDGEIAEPAQAQAAAEPLSPAEPRRSAEHRAAPAVEAREPARYRPDAVSGARPQPGSLADFRRRLERLPYGHPSSPYHVDGERKPPPPRLKHLELAPPAPSRVSIAGGSGGSSPRVSIAGGSGGSSPRVSIAGGSGGSSPRVSTAGGSGGS